MSGIDDTLRFDPLEHLEQIGRFEVRNRSVAEIGNHPLVNLLAIPLPGGLRQRRLFCQQPFVGDGCKGVGYGIAFGTTLCTGVNTVRYGPPSFIALLACSFQRDVGVSAQGEQFFYPSNAVPKAPETSAGAGYKHEKAALVGSSKSLYGFSDGFAPLILDSVSVGMGGYRVAISRDTPPYTPPRATLSTDSTGP